MFSLGAKAGTVDESTGREPGAPIMAAREAHATETAPSAARRPCGAAGMAASTTQLPAISSRLWPVFNAAFTATLL